MTKITGRLHKKYVNEVVPMLTEKFKVKNLLAVPRVTKVVLNSSMTEFSKNKEFLEQVKRDIAAISGQMPQVRLAKKAVASFGIRQGVPVGLKVTLRKEKMYSFLDKLFSIVFPRLRDFRGVSDKSFDKAGNYTLGLTEHTVFPEIDITKVKPFGIEITIVSNSGDREKAYELLKLMGMPFEKGDNYGKKI